MTNKQCNSQSSLDYKQLHQSNQKSTYFKLFQAVYAYSLYICFLQKLQFSENVSWGKMKFSLMYCLKLEFRDTPQTLDNPKVLLTGGEVHVSPFLQVQYTDVDRRVIPRRLTAKKPVITGHHYPDLENCCQTPKHNHTAQITILKGQSNFKGFFIILSRCIDSKYYKIMNKNWLKSKHKQNFPL